MLPCPGYCKQCCDDSNHKTCLALLAVSILTRILSWYKSRFKSRLLVGSSGPQILGEDEGRGPSCLCLELTHPQARGTPGMRHNVLRVVPEPGCHLWVLERAPRVPQPIGSKQSSTRTASPGEGAAAPRAKWKMGPRGRAGPLPTASPPQDMQGARLFWC